MTDSPVRRDSSYPQDGKLFSETMATDDTLPLARTTNTNMSLTQDTRDVRATSCEHRFTFTVRSPRTE